MSSYGNYLDRWLEAAITRDTRADDKLDAERSKYLDDPVLTEKLVAHHARLAVPEKKQVKIPYGSNLAKTVKGIPEGDPRHGIGQMIMEDFPAVMEMNPGMRPQAVIANMYRNREKMLQEETYKYKRKQEASFIFKDDTAPAAGYEEWVKKERAKPGPEWEWTNPLESFGFGAATAGIGAGVGAWGKRALAKGATGKLASFAAKRGAAVLGAKAGGVVGGPLGAVAGAGVGMAIDFFGYDLAKNLLAQTEWGKAHQVEGSLDLADIAQEALGFATMTGTGKALKKLTAKYDWAKTMLGKAHEKAVTDPSIATITQFDLAKNRLASVERRALKAGEFETPSPGGRGGFPGEPSTEPGAGVLYDLMGEGEYHNLAKSSKEWMSAFEKDIQQTYGIVPGPKLVKSPFKIEGDEVAKASEIMSKTGVGVDEAVTKVIEGKIGENRVKTVALRDLLAQRKDITSDPEKFSLVKKLHAAGENPDRIIQMVDEGEAINALDLSYNVRKASLKKEQGMRQRLESLGYTGIEETPYRLMRKMYENHLNVTNHREGMKFLKENVSKRVNDDFLKADIGINPQENIDQLESIFKMAPETVAKKGRGRPWKKDEMATDEFTLDSQMYTGFLKMSEDTSLSEAQRASALRRAEMYRKKTEGNIAKLEGRGLTESLNFKPLSGTPEAEEEQVFRLFLNMGLDAKGQTKVLELAEKNLVTKGDPSATRKAQVISRAYDRYRNVILKNVPNEVDDIADTVDNVLHKVSKGELSENAARLTYTEAMHKNAMGEITDAEFKQIEDMYFASQKGRKVKAPVEKPITSKKQIKEQQETPSVTETAVKPVKKKAKKVKAEVPTGSQPQTFREFIEGQGGNWDEVAYSPKSPVTEEWRQKYKGYTDSFAAEGAKKGTGNKLLPILIASASLVPLASLISPDEANAGTIDTAKRLLVHPWVAKTLGETVKNKEEMVKKFVELGMTSPEVNPAKAWEFPGFMRVPQVIPDIKQLVYRGASKFMDKIWSPSVVAERYYGTSKDGIKAMANPMVELGLRESAAQANAHRFLEVSENILKDVPGYKTAKVDVAKAMEGLEKKYFSNPNVSENLGVARWHASEAKFYEEEVIPKLARNAIKAEGSDKAGAESLLQSAMDKYADHKVKLEGFAGLKTQYEKEWEETVKGLAEKYSSTRISLAVEGVGMGPGGWLEPLLSKEERVAAGRFRNLYDSVAVRMKEVGEAPIEAKAYIHHATHPKSDWNGLKKLLEKETPDADGAYLMSHFHHRSYASRQMMPDIEYINQKYAPDAMKRIEMADFWKRGSQDGWEAHRKIINANGWKGAMEFWNGIDKAMAPVEKNTLTRLSRIMYAAEVSRLLFLSPSVALKHAMKLEANMSNFGVGEALKMYPSTLSETAKSYVAGFAEKYGMKGREKDILNDVMRTYTTNNRLMSVIQDMGMYDPPQTWTERMLQKFNEKGATLVNFTERFDRAHSFLAAMDMAAKKGMTAEQAAYGVMDTILKTNFLSGVQNPGWLRNPNVRLMMMFQGTPFKILEQRMLLAQRAGKDVGDMIDKLKQLRADVRRGEGEFKLEMLKDAFSAGFRQNKDVFGIPYTDQLARKMAILGTLLIGGRALFESDLSAHLFHMPGLQGGGRVMFNPIISAGFEARANEETDDTWLSSFFQKWLPSGPVPAIMMKGARLTQGDIPERYRDNRFRYIFGIPTTKED